MLNLALKLKKKRKEITVKKDTNFQCRVYIMIFFPGFDHVLLLYLLSMTKNFLEISFCLLYTYIYIKIKELYLALLLRVEIMTNILW